MTIAAKPQVSVEVDESEDDILSDNSEVESRSEAQQDDDLDIQIKEENEEDIFSESFDADEISEIKEEDESFGIKEESDDDEEEEEKEVVTSDEYDSEIDIKSEDEFASDEDSMIKSEETFESESQDMKQKKRKEAKSRPEMEKKVRIDLDTDSDSTESSDDDNNDEDSKDKLGSDAEDSKSGLANVMAQILAKSGSDDVMLSKAKKDYMVKKEEDTGTEFEVVDADGKITKEVTIKVEEEEEDQRKLAQKKRLEKEQFVMKFKLKPDFQRDREKERKLKIIATQGVVQLFTAIEKHKSMLKQQLSKTKSSFGADDLNPTDLKESFLNLLDQEGEKFKRAFEEDPIKKEIKHEESAPKKPKWNVFADNFYKEPTLQGWDAKSDDED
ncbi:hypothetical protein SK128_004449 [Halocaridina rubra]|uniref:RRP15-like protein n=1 Tax=Halocaridina rubra TaxID=373956 RepID=A0AAN9AH21_HALRR